ncbi:MAG TPA: LysR substrate-binding domain-containing protein [Chloroflexota bacterium]|nr:LysR substrate-binding domain-containing protein [Chloroflexota bacterium]
MDKAYSESVIALNLYHLRVFLAVARRLSFSRAAEELFISQPAVSRHVHDLEKEIDATLFGQTGNRVYLTEAGRLVYGYAQRLFDVEAEMMRALRELEEMDRGTLRLGASDTVGTYLLPPVIAAFQQRYPRVEVSLSIDHDGEIERMLLENDLDLGFAVSAEPPGLQARPYAGDRLVLIVPPGHRLAEFDVVGGKELEEETLLLREAGSSSRMLLEAELARAGITPRRTIELRGCEATKRGVIAGMGVAVVSGHSIEEELRHGSLTAVDLEGLKLEREISIISRKEARPSVSALTFTAMALKASTPTR